MSDIAPDGADSVPQDTALTDVFPTAVQAVKTGDVETLTRLLRENAPLANAPSLGGRTLLLHLCDWPGHCPRERETGVALIRAGADVNARAGDPEKGETPLQWAASCDDAVLAELLIDAGTPVDGLNNDRRPLAQAIWYGCSQVAETLVRRGATLDLELASGMGRYDLLPTFFRADGRLLPRAGQHHPPVNTPALAESPADELLEQALVYAVLGGSVEAAEYLLDHGAHLHRQPSGFDGRGTPLHWAASKKSRQMVEFLVGRGADLTAIDPKYQATPLGWAEHFQEQEMVALLKSLGAP
ncbi:MAG: ankyrin repeat domain-containing protein [Ktedonobacterales bacterium]|nr:ankyrin repeat domain-containing protein [Ktedonobacterales bacterium]